ncbi:MAG: hypothetical protein ACTSRZ_04275 [Promethearchaeota archaeon]
MSKDVEVKLKKKQITKEDWIFIIISAFSVGFAWRVRGDSGFGGMTGMISPAIFLTLMILLRFGKNWRYRSEIIGLIIALMAVTANGWGTINGQITGVLRATERPGVAGYDIKVNPISGAFCMFLVGFGWVAIWAACMGLIFSEREYKWRDLVKVSIFYGVFRIVSEIFLAHLIVPFIAPNAYALYAESLSEIDGNLTPWSAYILHYFNQAWYETVAGGRNYAATVSNLSSCIGVIGNYLILYYYYKDRDAAKIELNISLIFGISILIADLWIFWDFGGLWRESLTAPDWVQGWTFWEYSTGFLSGWITMLYLIKHNMKKESLNSSSLAEGSRSVKDLNKMLPKKEGVVKFFYIVFVIYIINFYAIILPFYERLDNLLGINQSVVEIVFLAVVALILLIFAILKIKKIFRISLEHDKSVIFSFIFYLIIYFVIYIFIGNLNAWNSVMNYIMLISFIATLIGIYLIIRKRKKLPANAKTTID